MKNTTAHDFGQPKTPATLKPFVFTWEFCATSGKGKNKTYKTLLSGKTTVTDVFSVYKRAEKEAGEKGIKKGNNILLKCYLIPSKNPLDIQRVALHAAKIIASAKMYKGNSTMDKVIRELSYICAYIGGETACKSELAECMLNSAVLNCSDETRNFLQEANLSAWANRDKTPENLYSAIYSDLHKFIHKEQKYKDICKTREFDDVETVTASVFEIGLPEYEIDETGEAILLKAIATLAERQRAYTTRHYEGYSDQEIADEYETTADAVAVGRRKARKNVLDYLQENAPEMLDKIDVIGVYRTAAKLGSETAKRSLHDLEVREQKRNASANNSEITQNPRSKSGIFFFCLL